MSQKMDFNVAKNKFFKCQEEIRFFNVAINGYLMLPERQVFLMSQQISFQCRKNEIFNVARKEYFYVAKN